MRLGTMGQSARLSQHAQAQVRYVMLPWLWGNSLDCRWFSGHIVQFPFCLITGPYLTCPRLPGVSKEAVLSRWAARPLILFAFNVFSLWN